MTKCHYFSDRYVDIQSTNALLPVKNTFSLILIKCDILIMNINTVRHILTNDVLLCLNETDVVEVLTEKGMEALTVSFTPEFINPNLDFSLIRSAQYAELQEKHLYPGFDLFLRRSVVYTGMLPINEEFASILYRVFREVDKQVHDQPDGKWSCRSRSNLFSVFEIAGQAYLDLTEKPSSKKSVLQNVIRYMRVHVSEHITVEQLCNRFNVNRTTLTTQFKKQVGFTPIEYLIEYRIKRCRYDLAFTELTLKEISGKYSFFDSTYFSKMFSARTGMTPHQYRNEMRNARPDKSVV